LFLVKPRADAKKHSAQMPRQKKTKKKPLPSE